MSKRKFNRKPVNPSYIDKNADIARNTYSYSMPVQTTIRIVLYFGIGISLLIASILLLGPFL